MEGRWLCAVMPTRRAQEEAADGTRSSGSEGNVGLSIDSKNRHRFKEKKSTEKPYENGIYSVNTLRNPNGGWELGCWRSAGAMETRASVTCPWSRRALFRDFFRALEGSLYGCILWPHSGWPDFPTELGFGLTGRTRECLLL